MKRMNFVSLVGDLVEYRDRVEERVWVDERDGVHGYTLMAVVESDRPEYGGRHPLLVPGRHGLELRAMLLAHWTVEGTPVFEVVVDGWLWSGRHRSWVVGDRVQHRIRDEVRDLGTAIFSRWLRLLMERRKEGYTREGFQAILMQTEEGLVRRKLQGARS